MVLFAIQIASAQIPQTISYQGVLTDINGKNVPDGEYAVTFKLYTVATGGTPIWFETQSITVKNGILNMALGTVNSLDLPFDQSYWLSVTIGTRDEVTQRMPLSSTPYSLSARSVPDSSLAGDKIASGQVVRSINSLTDDVTFQAGENVTITQDGHVLVISASVEPDKEADITLLATKTSEPKKFWETKGNKDTDPTKNFLGTTDNQPLVIKTNDAEAMRINTTGNVGIGTTNPIGTLHLFGVNPKIYIERNGSSDDMTLRFYEDGTQKFNVGLATGVSERLDITDGANVLMSFDRTSSSVGIGTISPGAKLEIAGQVKITGGAPGLNKVLTSDVNGLASWQTTSSTGGLYQAYVMVSDKKASGANGGLFISGSWQRRVINTEDSDPQNIASISGNQITLVAGTYRCSISCPAFKVLGHQARLQNVTAGTTLLLGQNAGSLDDLGAVELTRSLIKGRFILSVESVLEIQHRCQQNRGVDGFGLALGFGTEVYTVAEFWREN